MWFSEVGRPCGSSGQMDDPRGRQVAPRLEKTDFLADTSLLVVKLIHVLGEFFLVLPEWTACGCWNFLVHLLPVHNSRCFKRWEKARESMAGWVETADRPLDGSFLTDEGEQCALMKHTPWTSWQMGVVNEM